MDGSEPRRLDRRLALQLGGAIACGGWLAGCASAPAPTPSRPEPAGQPPAGSPPAEAGPARIRRHRTLGRTGFRVSDIALGCGNLAAPEVVRHAFALGVNYLDTAEGYGNGDSERKIGQALEHLPRAEVFVTTKLKVEAQDTEQALLARFDGCQERLGTPYVDALMMHAVARRDLVGHAGFHALVARLKGEGRLRHAGISSHGPRGQEGDSMEGVLLAAVEDGRFDLVLLIYSFLNHEQGARVLAACREKAVGTTGMKVTPGVLEVPAFDPDAPRGELAEALQTMLARGLSREEALARIRRWLGEAEENRVKSLPFLEKWGARTEEELQAAGLCWALENEDLHTACVSMRDFDMLERIVPLSGTRLGAAGSARLRAFARGPGRRYCRHGCTACARACPAGLPVATVMRYAYYAALQDRRASAAAQYDRLGAPAAACLTCPGPCCGACPYGVPVQASLVQAHGLLRQA